MSSIAGVFLSVLVIFEMLALMWLAYFMVSWWAAILILIAGLWMVKQTWAIG